MSCRTDFRTCPQRSIAARTPNLINFQKGATTRAPSKAIFIAMLVGIVTMAKVFTNIFARKNHFKLPNVSCGLLFYDTFLDPTRQFSDDLITFLDI